MNLIGRERGYHGVGFGGISVGGMVNNRKWFGPLLAGVMDRFGFGDRWAFQALHDDGRCYGMPLERVQELYRTAALIINYHGGTMPLPEHAETGRLAQFLYHCCGDFRHVHCSSCCFQIKKRGHQPPFASLARRGSNKTQACCPSSLTSTNSSASPPAMIS